MVQEWLEGREAEIEVVYLPAYSPELNPDEYLNNPLKKQPDSGSHRRLCRIG